MADILQMEISNSFPFMKFIFVLIKISLKYILKKSINNTPALVQILASTRTAEKPLSVPMMAWFTPLSLYDLKLLAQIYK